MTRYWLMPIGVLGLYFFFFANALLVNAAKPPQAPLELLDGARSEAELTDRLLDALARRDVASLHRLRVTRDEYLDIIVPGTVEPGQPLRQVSEQPREFFWRLLDQRSRDFGDLLLSKFGGRRYQREELHFTSAPTQYATYRALGQTRITVSSSEAPQEVIATGWMAEVDGRYKFIGFEWDN